MFSINKNPGPGHYVNDEKTTNGDYVVSTNFNSKRASMHKILNPESPQIRVYDYKYPGPAHYNWDHSFKSLQSSFMH